jgi:hypothetical protein
MSAIDLEEDDAALGRRLRSGELTPRQAAALVSELIRQVEAGGASPAAARGVTAARLQVSRDFVDERMVLAVKLETDEEIAERLAKLEARLKKRGNGPPSSGLSVYRLILRIEPRSTRMAVLDELEREGGTDLSYREIIRAVERIRARLNVSDKQSHEDTEQALPFRAVAPNIAAALDRLGATVVERQAAGLSASDWYELLTKDRKVASRLRYLATHKAREFSAREQATNSSKVGRVPGLM